MAAKMKIKTVRFGEIEIDPAEIITIPDGIIGFPEQKRYIMFDFMEGTPFKLLQAVDRADLAFFLIEPELFYPGYELTLADADLAALNSDSATKFELLVILTIPEDPMKMTANLKGPLVFVPATRLARQVINNDQKFNTKHTLIQEPAMAGAGKQSGDKVNITSGGQENKKKK